MSDVTDNNIKEKELRIFDSSIKVYIPRSLVLLNPSTLKFTK